MPSSAQQQQLLPRLPVACRKAGASSLLLNVASSSSTVQPPINNTYRLLNPQTGTPAWRVLPTVAVPTCLPATPPYQPGSAFRKRQCQPTYTDYPSPTGRREDGLSIIHDDDDDGVYSYRSSALYTSEPASISSADRGSITPRRREESSSHVSNSLDVGNRPATTTQRRLSGDPVEDDASDRRLIEVVRNEEVIWDFNREDHKDREKMETVWRIIASELNRDDWKECEVRWKYLRNYFIALYRKKYPTGTQYEESNDKVKWKHFRAMTFLIPTLRLGRTQSNWPTIGDAADEGTVDVDLTGATPAKCTKRKRNSDQDNPTARGVESAIQLASTSIAAMVSRESATTTPRNVRDANTSLGETIGLLIATLDPKLQNQARVKVMNAVAGLIEEMTRGE